MLDLPPQLRGVKRDHEKWIDVITRLQTQRTRLLSNGGGLDRLSIREQDLLAWLNVVLPLAWEQRRGELAQVDNPKRLAHLK